MGTSVCRLASTIEEIDPFFAFGALLIAGVSTLLLWQHRTFQRLEAEYAGLRASTAELDSLRQENSRLPQRQTDRGAAQRIRPGRAHTGARHGGEHGDSHYGERCARAGLSRAEADEKADSEAPCGHGSLT